MSDLVERLRRDAEKARRSWPEVFCIDEDLAEEAADALEAQAKEIAELRAALAKMADNYNKLAKDFVDISGFKP